MLQVFRGTWKFTEVAAKQFLPCAVHTGSSGAAATGGVAASGAQVWTVGTLLLVEHHTWPMCGADWLRGQAGINP